MKQGNCRQYALLYLGRKEEAENWMDQIIESYPTEGNYYDAACLYSQIDKPEESIANLKKAFEHGYVEFIHLSNDDDLEKVRNMHEFKTLVGEWQDKNEKSQL